MEVFGSKPRSPCPVYGLKTLLWLDAAVQLASLPLIWLGVALHIFLFLFFATHCAHFSLHMHNIYVYQSCKKELVSLDVAQWLIHQLHN